MGKRKMFHRMAMGLLLFGMMRGMMGRRHHFGPPWHECEDEREDKAEGEGDGPGERAEAGPWAHHHGHGPWGMGMGPRRWGRRVPPIVEEWHRRMHEAQDKPKEA